MPDKAKAAAPLIEFEIVPKDAGIELANKQSIELAFIDYFQKAAEWKAKAATITDPKEAKAARLTLRTLRVAGEKKHKEMKEESLRLGRALDSARRTLCSLIEPIEEQLENVEKAEERRLAELSRIEGERRMTEIRPFLDPALPPPDVEHLTNEQFAQLLGNAKTLHAAKIENARIAGEQRIAKEKQEAADREKLRLENERLKRDAERVAAEQAAEREAQRKKDEAAAAERKALEDKLAAEKKAADDKLAKERAELAAQQDAARLAREAEDKRLADERAELKRKQDELAAIEHKKKDDEKARLLAIAAAEAHAAAAPDREKLMAYHAALCAIPMPALETPCGKDMLKKLDAKVQYLSEYIEGLIDEL